MNLPRQTGEERFARTQVGVKGRILFSMPFAVAGLVVIGMVLYQIGFAWSAQHWVEYPAVIRSVTLNESAGSRGGRTFSVRATYEYQVGGQTYTGNRVSLLDSSDNIGDFHQRVYGELKSYSVSGKPFRCFVNPSKPTACILYRDLRWGLLAFMGGLGSAFSGIGLGIMAYWYRRRRRAHAAIELSERYPDEPWMWEPFPDAGHYRPLPHWIVSVVLCVAVNGLGWGLIALVRERLWREPVLGLLLLIPIFGLFTVGPAWRAIRRRWEFGTPELVITPWPLRLGDRAHCELFCHQLLPKGELLKVTVTVERLTEKNVAYQVGEIQASRRVASDGAWFCELMIPDHLPPTTGILDPIVDHSCRWVVQIHQPQRPGGFSEKYQILVFPRGIQV